KNANLRESHANRSPIHPSCYPLIAGLGRAAEGHYLHGEIELNHSSEPPVPAISGISTGVKARDLREIREDSRSFGKYAPAKINRFIFDNR
ncbi:MAG TPA: hypothetical protein O0X97_06125, partial [Methanocorpusculum sp.]|nr:hypothetical protein [Methanocorpusculum sp.]